MQVDLKSSFDFLLLFSALHKAAMKGNFEACRWLLAEDGPSLGLQHMQPDNDNFTPMLFATANQHEELGNWLHTVYNQLCADSKP